ncbi:unnamed protein product [Rotaria socialis]|uniref:Tetratricopeptide repeat protein n=1 Tax=Rotaria socialis TaxID=392032 RepID=A0A820WET9_9BILA|nr:unnamed protein product [Rotaria socialis]
MYSVLFKEIVLEIDDDDSESFNKLIEYCHQQKAPESQLTYFQHEYHRQSPIWWYTKDLFIYGMLNKALRTLNVEESFTVYRGRALSQQNFQKLLKAKDGLLSFNRLLLTSKHRKISMSFDEDLLRKTTDTEGILFIITINQKQISTSTTPYAMIDDYSAICGELSLTLTDDNDSQLPVLTNRIREKISGEGWHRNASDDSDKACIYRQMRFLKNNQREYEKAATCYEKSLNIREKVSPSNHPDLTTSYNNIGQVYNNKGDHSKALDFYDKSNTMLEIARPPNHPHLAIGYCSIDLVYYNIGDYSKALEYFEKSIKISEIALPWNYQLLAFSYDWLGRIYRSMKGYPGRLIRRRILSDHITSY